MNFIDLKTQYQRIADEVQARMNGVFDHGQFIMGPEVAELETQLANHTGAKHCLTVSSGTDALYIALMALGVGRGDEVITTPFSFIASCETIALLGATPVFVDIDPATYNLDPALVESAITPNTKAIMPVSLYGQCADFDAINAIAAKHHLPVIEDGAQSFGATYKGRQSCNLTTIGCTSFFPSKPLGCYGDGGACFTNDDALFEAMKCIRDHGSKERYHHEMLGLNGRMDTLQCAALLAKLPIFQEEVALRQTIGKGYSGLFKTLCGERVVTPRVSSHNTSVYAQYTIQVPSVPRDALREGLQKQGIPTAVHYPTVLYLQPAFQSLGVAKGACPVSERASHHVLSLPMHPYLQEATQIQVVEALAKVLHELPQKGEEVTSEAVAEA